MHPTYLAEHALATVDGVTYVAQTMVYGHRDRDVFFHCALAEWAETPEARLAARDAEIAALKAELAQLLGPAAGPSARPKRPLSDVQIQARATVASHSIRWAICPACDTPTKKNNWRRHTAKCTAADEQGRMIMGEQPWPEEAATYPTREAAEGAHRAALDAQPEPRRTSHRGKARAGRGQSERPPPKSRGPGVVIRPRAAAAPGLHLRDTADNIDCSLPSMLDQLAQHPLLSADDERRLTTLAHTGDQAARDEMARCNQKLVIAIARMFRGRGMSFADLIQEGNIGLLRAIDKFSPARGLKFSTFAVWWIRQAIGRAVQNDGRVVRLPVHAYEALARLHKAQAQLTRELGEEPTSAQLAERMGLAVAAIERQLSWSSATVSLDASQTDAPDGMTLLDTLVVTTDAEIYGEVEQREVTANVADLLDTLGPRERQIIELRFGIGDCGTHTLDQIGTRLGITRERVRQLQVNAMETLRHYAARRPELQGVL